MSSRRRGRRRSPIIPTVLAIVIGLAVAVAIYWYQNRDAGLQMPQDIIDQVAKQRPQERAPESFAAITATDTPKPPTKAAPTRRQNEGRSVREKAESVDRVADLERKIHAGINAARAIGANTPPLQWDEHLGAIARAHSDDMTKRGYFSHDTPEGLGPSDRIEKVGYSCWKGSHYGIAENIAIEIASKNLDRVAASAVEGWMNSPGHRTNLLGRQYDRTGVGASFGRWRGYDAVYLTQVFC